MMVYKVRIDFQFKYEEKRYAPSEEAHVEYRVMQHMRRHGFGVPLGGGPVEDGVKAKQPVKNKPVVSKGALTVIEQNDLADDELAQITGSGKDGAILKKDVLEWLDL